MKFLKVFINSLISGILFSSLIALLVLNLNVKLPFTTSFFFQLSLYLTAFYGLVIIVPCMIFFFIIQFFSGRKIRIAFVSPSFLMISFTLLLILSFHIFNQNFKLFSTLFSTEIASLLQKQSQMLIYIIILGILITIANFTYKKKALFSALYFCLFCIAMTYIVFQRVYFPPLPQHEKLANLESKTIERKVTIIGLEGLSFDFIIPLTSQGKLPNFTWLMEEGSWGTLENFTPNEPIILNNSFNSGKFPAKHLQLSLSEYYLLNLKQGFPVTPRYIFFRQLSRLGILNSKPVSSTPYTKDIWDIFAANNTSYLKKDWPYEISKEKASQEAEDSFNRSFEDLRFETSEIISWARQAFCKDVDIEAHIMQEKEEKQPQLLYFLLPGLNAVETYFYKYSFPELFGEVDQEIITKYSTVIERYYQFYDEIIGKYLASKKEDELLIVYAPHGVEPLPVLKRYEEWLLGNPQVSAYHEHAPDGVIIFYGKDIVKGNNVQGLRLIDIAPTLLHYLGLPVGKDMDGIVDSSIFVDEFKTENPVLYISSYEEIDIKPSQ